MARFTAKDFEKAATKKRFTASDFEEDGSKSSSKATVKKLSPDEIERKELLAEKKTAHADNVVPKKAATKQDVMEKRLSSDIPKPKTQIDQRLRILPGSENDTRNFIGTNLIPAYEEDTGLAKVGKGIVNYGLGGILSTVGNLGDAIPQALMQADSAILNAASGKPQDFSQKTLRKDILPSGYDKALTSLAAKGKGGEFLSTGLDMLTNVALDPTTYVMGGVVDDLAKAGVVGKGAKLGTAENLAANAARGQKVLASEAKQAAKAVGNVVTDNIADTVKQADSIDLPKAEATMPGEIGKQTPVKNIDDYILDQKNKVDDLRYQRNELGVDTTKEIETAETELLRLQKKKYLPYYKEQLASLEKTQKEIFDADNDITPEFVDISDRIEKLKGRIGEIESKAAKVEVPKAEPVAEPLKNVEQAEVKKVNQTEPVQTKPEATTQPITAKVEAGQVNTPVKVETASTPLKRVSLDQYGEVEVIKDDGNIVTVKNEYGKEIPMTKKRFDDLKAKGYTAAKGDITQAELDRIFAEESARETELEAINDAGQVSSANKTKRNFVKPSSNKPIANTYDEYQKIIDDLDDKLISQYGEDEWFNGTIYGKGKIPKGDLDYHNKLVDERNAIWEAEKASNIEKTLNNMRFEQHGDDWIASRDSIKEALAKLQNDATGAFADTRTVSVDDIKRKLYNRLIQTTDAPDDLWGEYEYAKRIAEGDGFGPFGKSLKPLFKQIDDTVEAMGKTDYTETLALKQPSKRYTARTQPVANVEQVNTPSANGVAQNGAQTVTTPNVEAPAKTGTTMMKETTNEVTTEPTVAKNATVEPKAPSTDAEKLLVEEYTAKLPETEDELTKIVADLENQRSVEKDGHKLLKINLQLFAAKEKLKKITSKLYQNRIQKSGILTDAEKAQIPEKPFKYEVKPEATTTAQATERVNADWEKTRDELLAKETFDDVDTDSAMMVAERYRDEGRKTGDYRKMNEWFATIRPKATQTGRGSQAWYKWQNTPEGVTKRANDLIDDEWKNVKKTQPAKAKRVQDDVKAAKGGVKQASDEATDQAVKEAFPEDMLAKRVENTLKTDAEKKLNPLADMVNELFRVAKESPLPDRELMKRDPYSYLKEAIAGKGKYTEVWEKAKNIVKTKYADDADATKILDDYFNKGIVPTYSQKTLNSSVNAAMKELQVKMSDVVLKGEKDKAAETIKKFLIDKTFAKGDEAELLSQKIAARFDELFKEKAESILKSKLRLGSTSSPTMKNLIELINAGAFGDEDLLNVVKAKYKIPTLDSKTTQKIIDLADQYRNIEAKGMTNLLDRVEIASKIDYELAQLRTVTIGQKVASFNYIQQLSGTLTHIRNVAGNEALYRSHRFTQYPASLIDFAKSKLTGTDRQITFAKGFNPWEHMKSYWTDFGKGAKAGWQGYDLIRAETDKLIGSSKKFKGVLNPLKYMESMLGASLNGFDYAAYMRGTKNALYEMAALQAKNSGQKVTKEFVQNFLDNIGTESLEQAESLGKYLTLRNENTISDLLFGLKNYGNKLGIGENVIKKGVKSKEYGLGNVIMNYPQATGALLQMSIDYSPIGFIKGLGEISRPILSKAGIMAKGPIDYKKVVDTMSKAIVGTFGFTAVGYKLYDLELITGKSNDDYDYANLEQQMGKQEYSINIDGLVRYVTSGFDKNEAKPQQGDTFYSYSWLQPVAGSVSLGANVRQIQEEEQTTGEAAKGLLNTVLTSTEGALNTLTDQSVMTGLTKFVKGYDAKKNVEEMASGVVTGFTNSFANQLRKLNDNTRRSTDAQSAMSRTINKIKNRIPGLSESLPAIYGTDGQIKEMYQGGTNNILNVFLNPGFVSKYKTSPGINLVLQLYEDSGGEKKQFPRTVDGKTISYNKQNVRLTAEEVGELQKMIGLEVITMLDKKSSNEAFNKMDTDHQINNIVTSMNAIGEKARQALRKKIGKAELEKRLKD